MFPLEGTLSRCEISTLRIDNGWCDHLSDPMNCFDLFPQNWLPPQLSYTGLLEVTGVRVDVIVRSLFRAAKSVCFGAEPVVSDVTEDGDRIPMTTSTHSWVGESRCSEWLQFVSQGAGPMAPPIRAGLCTVVFFQRWGLVYIWIVCTRWESVGVLQVTGSLLHVVLACRLAVLSDCSSCDCLHVPRFCADSLLQLVCVVGGVHRTVPQDYFVDAMATGNSQPRLTGRESTSELMCKFRVRHCMLDTACVSDVLGLTRYPDAEPVRVLQGRAQESV